MEEVFDAVTGGAIWGIGFGLALTAVRGAGGGLRPLAKNAIKGAMLVTDWLQTAAEQSRETVEDLYHEAKTEERRESRAASRPRPSRSRRTQKASGAEA
jgi:hypothetical protein